MKKNANMPLWKWRIHKTGFIIQVAASWSNFFLSSRSPHAVFFVCVLTMRSANYSWYFWRQIIRLLPGIQTPPLFIHVHTIFNSIVQPALAFFRSQTNNITNYKTSTIHASKIRIHNASWAAQREGERRRTAEESTNTKYMHKKIEINAYKWSERR